MKWAALFHEPVSNQGQWSTPKGLIEQLETMGVELIKLAFEQPKCDYFPNIQDLLNLEPDVIIVFYAGKCTPLEQWMALLRIAIDNQGKEILIVSELGDEPQTRDANAVRAQVSDLCFTPDIQCAEFWSDLGCDAHWLTHWADEQIFFSNQSFVRRKRVATTMGKRKYSWMLSLLLGKSFVNRTCQGLENNALYNSAIIAFQFARWGEITRRIFEASACGCCVFTNRLVAQKCLEKIFVDGNTIVFYEGRLDLIKKLAKYLLFRPEEAVRIGARAAEVIAISHTAAARARELLYLAEDKSSKFGSGKKT